MKKSKICFIDFETSGIDVYEDSPIEIGAVLVDITGNLISEFHSYIKPRVEADFSEEAIKVHGLNKRDLINAPNQNDVLENFFNTLGDDFKFGGWNIDFDISFFKSMCHHSHKIDLYNKIDHRHIDVQSINFFMNELNFYSSQVISLSDLCNYFSLDRNQKHNALEDAKLTSKVYFQLKKLFEERLK